MSMVTCVYDSLHRDSNMCVWELESASRLLTRDKWLEVLLAHIKNSQLLAWNFFSRQNYLHKLTTCLFHLLKHSPRTSLTSRVFRFRFQISSHAVLSQCSLQEVCFVHIQQKDYLVGFLCSSILEVFIVSPLKESYLKGQPLSLQTVGIEDPQIDAAL
jgi:hypothetical protein